MTFLITTFFGAGLLRPAPGTWGSLAALPAAWGLYMLAGPIGCLIGIAVVFGVGWWATAIETRGKDDHDPSEIVIDEVAGQWIALVPLFFGAASNNVDVLALWPGWITAFLAFRFFDITKFGPIGLADRRGDALGVMLDDVIAGIFAAVVVVVFAGISHGLLMS